MDEFNFKNNSEIGSSVAKLKNKRLKLEMPVFTCDDGINENLNKYDMLSHFNKYNFTGVIGKPGSGKTSLIMSWLTSKKVFKKMFHHVLVVMPSSSIQSMKKNPFKNHDEDKMFEQLDLDSISTIYNKLEESSAEKQSTLLIMDDIGASLKNNSIKNTLRKIIYNRRHLKVSIIVLLQSFMSLEKEIRKLFNNVIMFKPSKVEFENLFEELFETNKDLALDIMNVAYDKPHDYLVLNVDSQKLYKQFDQIEIIK
jgi:DNA replication protein DnaC